MARIQLMHGVFTPIPEGHYVFHMDSVTYDEAFGKIECKMSTVPQGKKHTEKYNLLTAGNEVNEGALRAFSLLAAVCTHKSDLHDIDPVDLTGTVFEADVEHDVLPSRTDPNKTVTFVKLINKTEHGEAPAAETAADVDLDALLN